MTTIETQRHTLAGNIAYSPISDDFVARCACGDTFLGWRREDALDRLIDHQNEKRKAAA